MKNTKKIVISTIVLAVAAASSSSVFARNFSTGVQVKNSLGNDITITQQGGNMCLMRDGFEEIGNHQYILKVGTTGKMDCSTGVTQQGHGAKFDLGNGKSIAFFNPNAGSPHVDGYRGDVKDFELYHGWSVSNFLNNDYSGVFNESADQTNQSMYGMYKSGADVTTSIPFSVKMPEGKTTYINIGTTAPF